jgi:hypothetical protein
MIRVLRCLIVLLMLVSFSSNRAVVFAQQGGGVPQPHLSSTIPAGANVLEIPLPSGTGHRYLGIWGGYIHASATCITPGFKPQQPMPEDGACGPPIPPNLSTEPFSIRFVVTSTGEVAAHFYLQTAQKTLVHSKASHDGPDKLVVEVEHTDLWPEGRSLRSVVNLAFQLLPSKFDPTKDIIELVHSSNLYPAPDGPSIVSMTFKGTLERITAAQQAELDTELNKQLWKNKVPYSAPIEVP